MRSWLFAFLSLVAGSYNALAQAVTNKVTPESLADSPVAPGQSSFDFTIRRDFNDIGLFTLPKLTPNNQAIGALGSYTFDELANHNSASIDGVAAGIWRYYGDDRLLGIATGPFVQGDYTHQFRVNSLPAQNLDTVTVGGFIEFGLSDAFDKGQDYFRLRSGDVLSSTGVNSTNLTAEWIPIFDAPIPVGLPSSLGSPLFYLFTPELIVQYDHLNNGPRKYTLFSQEGDAVRIGSQFGIRLFVNTALLPENDPEWVRVFLRRTTFNLTFHPSVNIESNELYSYALSTLTYNLDDDGHVGISVSYGYGNSEATANMNNQVKLGLSAKF